MNSNVIRNVQAQKLFSGFVTVFLCLMVFTLNVSFRERGLGDDSVDWQVMLRLGVVLVAFAGSVLSYKAWIGNMMKPDNFLLMPLFLMMVISIGVAPSLTYSAGCTLSIIAVFLFMFASCAILGERRVLSLLISVSTLISVISLFFYFLIPDIGKEKEWFGDERIPTNRLSGVTGANGAGFISASVILMIAISRNYAGKINSKLVGFCLVINLMTLALSESRTAIFAMLLALSYFFFAYPTKGKIVMFLSSILCVIIFAVTVNYDDLMVALSRSGNAEEITTGTGRLYIWQTCFNLIGDKPFLGWGYGSSSFILPSLTDVIGHTPPHCHNVFIQMAFSLGIQGFVVLLALIVMKLAVSFLKGKHDCVALGIFILIVGLTEASAFIGLANMATIMYAMLFALGGTQKSRSQPQID